MPGWPQSHTPPGKAVCKRVHWADVKTTGKYSAGLSGFNWHFRMFSASGPPGDLTRRGVFRQSRIGVARRRVGDRSREVRVAGQVAEIERSRRFRLDDFGL